MATNLTLMSPLLSPFCDLSLPKTDTAPLARHIRKLMALRWLSFCDSEGVQRCTWVDSLFSSLFGFRTTQCFALILSPSPPLPAHFYTHPLLFQTNLTGILVSVVERSGYLELVDLIDMFVTWVLLLFTISPSSLVCLLLTTQHISVLPHHLYRLGQHPRPIRKFMGSVWHCASSINALMMK